MPDFTDNPIKFNPDDDDYNPGGSVNTGDWTGHVLGGGPRGVATWLNLEDAVGTYGYMKRPVHEFVNYHQRAHAFFTNADPAGTYILGHAGKVASGAGATQSLEIFHVNMADFEDPDADDWTFYLVANLTINSVDPACDIGVGISKVTIGGAAGVLTATVVSGTTHQFLDAATAVGRSHTAVIPVDIGSPEGDYAITVTLPQAIAVGSAVSVVAGLGELPYIPRLG